jgi:hypothetical protein
VEVEEWLHSLSYAPATKSKIRNIMSAVFNHAIRHTGRPVKTGYRLIYSPTGQANFRVGGR